MTGEGKVDLTRLTIGDLLYRRQPFEIPKYQRSYAWEREDIEDFIADLERTRAKRQAGQPKAHFMGSVVSFLHSVPGTIAGKKYEVVDGQQRLATFSILFSVLRDAYRDLADKATRANNIAVSASAAATADKLEEEFLEYEDVVDGRRQPVPRLILSKADREFFIDLIRGNPVQPTRESHKRLQDAKRRIQRELVQPLVRHAPTLEDALASLLALELIAKEDCYVVHHVADSREEAYRLFEVLNDRGKGLTEGDMLRSATLEQLERSPDLQAKGEAAWDDLLKGSPREIEGFLRAYYASHRGERAGRRTLFDDFNDAFFKSATGAPEVWGRLASMRAESEIYRRLESPVWPYENSTLPDWDKNRLRLLIDTLRHTLCMPLLMAAARSLDERKFSEVVQSLERFTFRYVSVSRAHVGKLTELYNEHSKEIRRSPATYSVDDLNSDLRQLLTEGAPDAVFSASLVERLTYGSGDNRLIKYCLTTLEQYGTWYERNAAGPPVCEDKSTIFDLTSLQIEHIYPQNPQTIIQELETQKQRLGNLSVWHPTDNRAASNSDFETKRPFYQNSNIRLNRRLATTETWNKQALEARQAKLVEMALAIFQM